MQPEGNRNNVICMVGTDHALAPVDVRSAFTLSAEARDAVLPLLRITLGATGVVLLSTCNRVELWASFDGVEAPACASGADGTIAASNPMLEALCAAYNVDPKAHAGYFVTRSGNDAVSHLFHVACGLRSAIMAEDQIISQVKQAVAVSRELGIADACLEVLFRQAITAAKQVKSGVRFTRAYGTAVEQAIAELEQRGVDISRTACLVIGNGEYGRLAASTLAARGADVTVTVRQYTHGTVSIPGGCTGVPYASRYERLTHSDIVMSATSSPHFTLEHDQVEAALGDGRELFLVDLAVPRDIDPLIGALPGCTLMGIDDFSTDMGSENRQAVAAANKILESGMADFWDWMHRRKTMSNAKAQPAALFPLFVDISDKHVVFVGGGAVALRRVRTLLPFVDDIKVYAPSFSPELEQFAADGAVELIRKSYHPSVLDGADIVLACTSDTSVNDAVWEECKKRNVLVNVSSDRFKCDFHFPGVVQRDNVVVGVNAGGKAHRRVKQLRARIDRLMDEEDV